LQAKYDDLQQYIKSANQKVSAMENKCEIKTYLANDYEKEKLEALRKNEELT